MDVEKAIAYVQARGNAIERARLAAILWDEPPSEATLSQLAASQNPDGGFAYWLQPAQVSTVCNTAFVLQWFDDLRMYDGPIVDPAVLFLLAHQQEDGGWDEVEWEAEDGEEFAVSATIEALRALRGYERIP